ncbi:MAG: RibD family protein [Acetobacteraceae bacterium]|nr:RibD family protein [Acetobacteraceae bacterium]MDW8398717.1 RibD family protein [Acetobacteraceae bacterium]
MDGPATLDMPDDAWAALLAARTGGALPSHPAARPFLPLFAPPAAPDGCIVVGRLAQTLDGRIATTSGSSQWIGGRGDLLHTHRLRALCDAVVVGAGTVAADDPRLTTREVPGPDPVRVVLDPSARLPAGRKLFQGGPPTLHVVAEDAAPRGHAETLRLPRALSGGLDLSALLAALAARGLKRIFVEGGGETVSRFLAAGLLDRLHLTVAPMILGSGRPAFILPEASRIDEGLRFSWTVFPMGDDILIDAAIRRARPPVCGAG